MLECFLVVALSIDDRVVTRTMSMLDDVPPQRIEFTMAIEAGRRSGQSSRLRDVTSDHQRSYGYDCGEGWVDKGVARTDVFAG